MNAERKIIIWAGMTLTCGVILIASTFMPWIVFQAGGRNLSGSAWEHLGIVSDLEHGLLDCFVDRGFGTLIFTAYVFVVVGASLILTFAAAFVSAANIYSTLTVDIRNPDLGMSAGAGLYVSLAFSIVGIAGYFIIYSGMSSKKRPRP